MAFVDPFPSRPPTHSSSTSWKEANRHLANYHPPVWGDFFLAVSPPNMGLSDKAKLRIEELKAQVKFMLNNASDSSEKINLIDVIQRLGVAYHFEIEIEDAFCQIYYASSDEKNEDDNLHDVALQFRLLRQQGYNVSSEVFKKFQDENGNFKETITSDTRAMLSLYDAAYLSTQQEDVLDEALAFTTKQLRSMLPHLSSNLKKHVEQSLELPLHKGVPRLKARQFISFYQEEYTRNEALLELAILDFNILQLHYRRELRDISSWWKDVNLARKLPFARDRIVELYFWILGVYFEPQYSRGRMITTKIISLLSLMDDIYDVYGTFEELQLLTDAIQRWDITAKDQLPEYMQLYFLELLNTISEIEQEVLSDEKYRGPYLKQAIKDVTKGYFDEANWLNKGYQPTMEEYMKLALVTCAYPTLTLVSFVGMGEVVKKEAFEWLGSVPKIIKATSTICRLVDDIQSHKLEQERPHFPSSVEVYMKAHECTEVDACKKLREMVSSAWKDINRECLKPTAVPMPLIMRIVNLTRVIEVLYQYEDGYTNSKGVTKDRITSVLVDPVPLGQFEER